MNKYKIEDLKVGAAFKESGGSGTIIRTIIAVGETNVFYSYPTASNRIESICSIGGFLNGNRGELVVPTTKIAYSDLKVGREIMHKYTLEDLKIGAVFKKGDFARTIIAVGKSEVFYSYNKQGRHRENCTDASNFRDGHYGELVRPTKKVTYVEYWNCHDLSSKKICSKERWDSRTSPKTNKFIREFEIEVGADGFPIEGGV